MYRYFNLNPLGKSVGDCTVRAIAKATNKSWIDIYYDLCDKGAELADMPSSNAVWGAYLYDIGFRRKTMPNTCPDCYSVADFANDHQYGIYILALSGHVVCVIDGVIYDAWDSSNETVIYYWER